MIKDPEWYARLNGSTFRVFDARVDKSFDKPDVATFNSVYNFEKGAVVELFVKQIGFNKEDRIYIGHVANCETVKTNKIYKITLQEFAVKIYNIYMAHSDNRGFFRQKLQIRNPDQNGQRLTVNTYINRINSYDASHAIKSVSVSSHDSTAYGATIPGTDTELPDFPMAYMSLGTALDKFIKDVLGLHYWFDYSNTNDPNTFNLVYGRVRDLRTLDVAVDSDNYMLINDSSQISQQVIIPVQRVVLLSKNAEVSGSAGASDNPMYSVVYKIDGNFSQDTLNSIASRIYTDRAAAETALVFKVSFPLTKMATWNAGDAFAGLGDQTSTPVMPFRSSGGWQINDMTITGGTIECVVGGTYVSVFDVYRNRLQIVDGADLPTERKEVVLGKTSDAAENQTKV